MYKHLSWWSPVYNCSECQKPLKKGETAVYCDDCGDTFHIDCVHFHNKKHIPGYLVIEKFDE